MTILEHKNISEKKKLVIGWTKMAYIKHCLVIFKEV